MNGMFAIEMMLYVECPLCGKIGASGEAGILVVLDNEEYFVGQPLENDYVCQNCQRPMREGDIEDTRVTACFPTLQEAERRTVELARIWQLESWEKFVERAQLIKVTARNTKLVNLS